MFNFKNIPNKTLTAFALIFLTFTIIIFSDKQCKIRFIPPFYYGQDIISKKLTDFRTGKLFSIEANNLLEKKTSDELSFNEWYKNLTKSEKKFYGQKIVPNLHFFISMYFSDRMLCAPTFNNVCKSSEHKNIMKFIP